MAKKTSIWLIAILVLALVLRLIKIDQSFWLDEAAQGVMSSQPVAEIWFNRPGDFHPPLFYILAHYFIQLSRSETFLRLLPVSFGLINVWLMYIFARYLFPKHEYAGLLAAFLLAVSSYHIYYSQEFRSYSLLCLLGTASMYFFYRKKFLSLGIINVLLLYNHYASVFLIISQFLYWLSTNRKQFPRYPLSLVFSVILYLPWLPQLLLQLRSGLSIGQTFPGWSQLLSVAPLKLLPLTIFKITAGRISFLDKYLYLAYIVSIIGIFFFGIFVTFAHRRFLFTWFFLPVLIMLVVSLVLPQNQPFRVIYILPALILLFTQSCIRFPKLFITCLIYISLVGNISYYTRPRLQREQWRQAVSFVRSQSAPAVLAFPGILAPFTWYAPDLRVFPAFDRLPPDINSVEAKLQPVLSQPKLLVFDYLSPVTDPSDVVGRVLSDHRYKYTFTDNFDGVGFIKEYQKQ